MPTYLCTCGTSAAKKLPREPRFDANWVKTQGGIDAAAAILYAASESGNSQCENQMKA